MKILGIDLGKYNSVACLFDTVSNEYLFISFISFPSEFKNLLAQSQPVLVIIEWIPVLLATPVMTESIVQKAL